MADVTVNIRGNASQLRDELNSVTNQAQQGGQTIPPAIPSTTFTERGGDSGGSSSGQGRMIEDVRREMQQRGVVLVPGSQSMSQIVNQYGQAQRDTVEANISQKYDIRRADMRSRMSADYDRIEEQAQAQREEGLLNLGDNANDPFYIQQLDQRIDKFRDSQYRTVGKRYDEEEENINKEEEQEKTQAQTELTEAIKELTEHFNRESEGGGSGGNSYIGNLREQRRALIEERDSADTKEEALDAQKRLSEVDGKLKDVVGGGGSQQAGLRGIRMGVGALGAVNSLQNGDIGGGLVGAAAMTGNPYVIAGAAVLSSITKMFSSTSETFENMAGLAAYRSTTGFRGADSSSWLGANLPYMKFEGRDIADFGMSTEDFAAQASKRIRERGMTEDYVQETFKQVGLERTFALGEGALASGGQYDRYGTNVTDAISRLVTVLSQIETSGVSSEDFTRVKEKYDIQQQIMGSYMGRTDRPNYDTANQLLAAFSSIEGITQDSRIGGEIQVFQNAIQNPMNAQMKSIIYSTVADLFPSTGGRMDKIDRAIRDPENEGKIMQAVIERLSNMFGGMDTQMGYFAFKSVFPGISPDRLEQMVSAFDKEGEYSANMLGGDIKNQRDINYWADQDAKNLAMQSADFTSSWNSATTAIINKMDVIIGKLTGTTLAPPNGTK